MSDTFILIQLNENGAMEMHTKGMSLSRAVYWLDYFHAELLEKLRSMNTLPPEQPAEQPETPAEPAPETPEVKA